jgi:hypothetical protein
MPKATPCLPLWRGKRGPRAVRDPVHAWTHLAREPGDLRAFCILGCRAHREARGRTPMSHGKKPDCCAVPRKPPNNAGSAMAGPRRWWREGGGPRAIRLLATCTGLRTGFVRQASRGGYEGLLHAGPVVTTKSELNPLTGRPNNPQLGKHLSTLCKKAPQTHLLVVARQQRTRWIASVADLKRCGAVEAHRSVTVP